MLRSRHRLLGALLVACSLCACGTTSSGGTAPAVAVNPLKGIVTVFAAASLTEALSDVRTKLQAGHPGLVVTDSFAGSQVLVAQIESGAPADVIATADTATMQKLVTAGLVEPPHNLAHNKLEIVVAPGNPRHVTGLADFARTDLRVILEDSSVPAGRYARQLLQASGITAKPVSLPLDVRSELLAVEQGNADAGIVYVTDVAAAGPAVTAVAIPDSENAVATYQVAVVKATSSERAARAYVAELLRGVGRRALLARGFLAP